MVAMRISMPDFTFNPHQITLLQLENPRRIFRQRERSRLDLAIMVIAEAMKAHRTIASVFGCRRQLIEEQAVVTNAGNFDGPIHSLADQLRELINGLLLGNLLRRLIAVLGRLHDW